MAAQRQYPDPEPRPRLEIVQRTPPLLSSIDGTPMRGIALGVAVSVAAFWLPAALVLLRLR